jgi:hypothetical protein
MANAGVLRHHLDRIVARRGQRPSTLRTHSSFGARGLRRPNLPERQAVCAAVVVRVVPWCSGRAVERLFCLGTTLLTIQIGSPPYSQKKAAMMMSVNLRRRRIASIFMSYRTSFEHSNESPESLSSSCRRLTPRQMTSKVVARHGTGLHNKGDNTTSMTNEV